MSDGLFQGEKMICALCGRVQQSHPKVESNWRHVSIDGQGFYICTKHYPADDRATARDFAKAHGHVIRSLVNRMKRGKL